MNLLCVSACLIMIPRRGAAAALSGVKEHTVWYNLFRRALYLVGSFLAINSTTDTNKLRPVFFFQNTHYNVDSILAWRDVEAQSQCQAAHSCSCHRKVNSKMCGDHKDILRPDKTSGSGSKFRSGV